jgi:hypothetical protein
MTLSINLHSIHCKTESDEASDSDEPYVLITTVQFLPVPDVRTFLYGPWETDDGDTRDIVTEPPFWGLDSAPTDILATPAPPPPPPVPVLADLLYLVTVMEKTTPASPPAIASTCRPWPPPPSPPRRRSARTVPPSSPGS